MTTTDRLRNADGRTTVAEQYVKNLPHEAKVEAALMLLALQHGQRHGHWSGNPATLETALWEHAGLDGATLEIDVRQLPCVSEWCLFDMKVREGKLLVTVTNTVVK